MELDNENEVVVARRARADRCARASRKARRGPDRGRAARDVARGLLAGDRTAATRWDGSRAPRTRPGSRSTWGTRGCRSSWPPTGTPRVGPYRRTAEVPAEVVPLPFWDAEQGCAEGLSTRVRRSAPTLGSWTASAGSSSSRTRRCSTRTSAHGRADRAPRRRGRGRGGPEPPARRERGRGRAAPRRPGDSPATSCTRAVRSSRQAAVVLAEFDDPGEGRCARARLDRVPPRGGGPRRARRDRRGRASSPATRAGAPGQLEASSRRTRGSSRLRTPTTSSTRSPSGCGTTCWPARSRRSPCSGRCPSTPRRTEVGSRGPATEEEQPWRRRPSRSTSSPGTGSRPYFEATKRHGCRSWGLYNHMLLPTLYSDSVDEYWALVNDVTVWDVSVERCVEIRGPGRLRADEPDDVS